LLERRPYIAASERNMAAANAQIGIAYVAYYPSLTLSPTVGFESSTLQQLLSWPSRFWSIGGSLSQTLFDAGLRRATVDQFIATYNAAVAGYRQTVLTAFQQVEDNLAAVLLNKLRALINAQWPRGPRASSLLPPSVGDESQLPTPPQVAQKPTKAESTIQH
jgi:outer membrane protein TolC